MLKASIIISKLWYGVGSIWCSKTYIVVLYRNYTHTDTYLVHKPSKKYSYLHLDVGDKYAVYGAYAIYSELKS